MTLRHLQYETGSRVRRAVAQVEQAHAIFEFTVTVFQHFRGFEDPEPYYRLQWLVNRTGLIGPTDRDTDSVGTAIRRLSLRHLPELLVISLVSAAETCLEDIAEVEIAAQREVSEDEASQQAYRLMRGGPKDYLPRLSELLRLPFLTEDPWQRFRELVATRNLLVHSYSLRADAKYIQQAGSFARFALNDSVEVDHLYLRERYTDLKFLLQHFLVEHPRRDA